MITCFYGADVSEADARALQEKISARFDELENEMHNGGQPLYYYIFSVE